MARFFKPSAFHGKNNEATEDLKTQSIVGIPFGWILSCASSVSSVEAHSLLSLYADDFMASHDPTTDFRLIIAAAHLSAQSWVKSKDFFTNPRPSDDLEVIHVAIDLFAGWKCPQEVTIEHWKTLVEAMGMRLTPETRANLQAELLDEWKAIKGPAVAEGDGGGPGHHLVELELSGMIQDGGFTLVRWQDDYQRVLETFTNETRITVFPPDFTVESLYTPAVLGDNVNYKKGIIYLHRYAKKHWPVLKRIFGKALMVFLASFMRAGDATDAWVKRRAADLETALGITLGEIELPYRSISIFRNSTKITNLKKRDIYTSLSVLPRNCNKIGYPRIGWMVDQVAYSGMTIVSSLLRLLAIYNNIPLGLIIGQMHDDLVQFLHAAMYGYLFPFSGLIRIKYSASKYPTLASFTVRACKDTIGGTIQHYGGTFAGSHPDKVDAAHKVFNDFRTDSVGSGRAVVTTTPNGDERLGRPEGMHQGLYDICTFGSNYSEMSVPVTGLLKIARDQEIASSSTPRALKILYQSVNALKTALENCPCDVYSIGSFERPLPGPDHELYDLAEFVNAAAMRCGDDED